MSNKSFFYRSAFVGYVDVSTKFVAHGKTNEVQARVRARHTDVVNFQGQWRHVLCRREDYEDGF